VSFGSAPATSFKVLNDNVITAFNPAGTGQVPVTVDGPSGLVTIGTFDYFDVMGVSAASQPGDADYAAATPVTHVVKISRAKTSTALQVSPNPAKAGQRITFTATVTSKTKGAPTPSLGKMKFYLGSTLIGTVTVSSTGVATLTKSKVASGTYSVTAVYEVSTNYTKSTSATVSLAIN
jgi:hypothetical protein